MSNQTTESVPSSEAFKNALLAIRADITPAQHRMLKAHCLAERHRITATQLAAAAEFPTYGAANLQYGLLGKSLGQRLGFTPPLRHDNGEPIWTTVLATGESPSGAATNEHFVWLMRPELVEALISLPWGIKPKTDASGNASASRC
jgi:hypothetical protein